MILMVDDHAALSETRLARFIFDHLEPILHEWKEFAESLLPLQDADRIELRDYAKEILKVIALDLSTPQFACDSIAKSKGLAAWRPSVGLVQPGQRRQVFPEPAALHKPQAQ